MRRFLAVAILAVAVASVGTLSAQLNFPEIPYDATAPLTLPANIHLGEAAGVATNSKGDIFVYTRTGTPVITTAGCAQRVARRLAAVPVRSHGQVRP